MLILVICDPFAISQTPLYPTLSFSKIPHLSLILSLSFSLLHTCMHTHTHTSVSFLSNFPLFFFSSSLSLSLLSFFSPSYFSFFYFPFLCISLTLPHSLSDLSYLTLLSLSFPALSSSVLCPLSFFLSLSHFSSSFSFLFFFYYLSFHYHITSLSFNPFSFVSPPSLSFLYSLHLPFISSPLLSPPNFSMSSLQFSIYIFIYLLL